MITFINICDPVVLHDTASLCRVDVVHDGDRCLSCWKCSLCGQRETSANACQDHIVAMTRAKRLAFHHWRHSHSPLRS